jgi:glycosyltransferase involved in cell wall biosynthesis
MNLNLDQLSPSAFPLHPAAGGHSPAQAGAPASSPNTAQAQSPAPPRRVLHVLRQLNLGGIECWLRSLLQAWDDPNEKHPQRPEFHLALEEADFGCMASLFESLGVRLHYCPAPGRPGSIAALRRVLHEFGPFDAIHCHNHKAAPFNLAIAALHGVPIRVAHSHWADLSHLQYQGQPLSRLYRQIYSFISRMGFRVLATQKITVSDAATLDLFGPKPTSLHFMPCGIDSPLLSSEAPTRTPGDASHGPERPFRLIHIARMVADKNHAHLLRVFQLLLQKEPNSELWLLGEGPLRPSLEALAETLGIAGKVRFFGPILDVQPYLADSDVFVFPSFNEGLGRGAVEAQAAGLPAVLAAHLPQEIELLPSHCRRLSLQAPLESWADLILSLRGFVPLNPAQRRQALRRSPFSMEGNIEILSKIYGVHHVH